jgi:hypothetical protein
MERFSTRRPASGQIDNERRMEEIVSQLERVTYARLCEVIEAACHRRQAGIIWPGREAQTSEKLLHSEP